MPEEVSKATNNGENGEAKIANAKEAEATEELKTECSNGVCTVVWKPSKAA